MPRGGRSAASVLLRGAGVCGALLAVVCGPKSAPVPAPSTAPLTLAVDATDVGRKRYRVHETVPATAGSLTLVYPKWLPGEHAPTGPITDLVGLTFSVG